MRLIKSFSIYGISSTINAGLPFVLLPVLTAYLQPEEYGLLAILQILILLSVPLVSINIVSAIQAEFNHLDQMELARLISTALFVPAVSVFILILLFYSAESVFRRFVDVSAIWILLIPIIAFFYVVPQLVSSLYQMSEKPMAYARYQVSLAATNLLLSILFVVSLHWNWQGRIVAILASYLLFSLLGIYILWKNKLLVATFKSDYLFGALKIGGPLIIHVISAALFMMSDRLFISYFLGNESVGTYAVGAQIAMIAMLAQQAFNQAWVPYVFRNLRSGNRVNEIRIIKISYIALLSFIVLPFIIDALSGPLFALLVDDQYAESIVYVFWVALGYSFLGMYKVVTCYIFYEKKTHLLAAMTFCSLLANILLNYFFIQVYGAIGVAYATALTVALFFVLAAVVAFRVHPMPWFSFRSNT